ncbi:MAG: lipase maturation factor family protein [Myxococcales bacterium]|nr:lipase maturation factor family protein [Myxococcales bacterium]
MLGSHFAQLVAPVLLFAPQPFAAIAGTAMAVTQLWLVLSGNFSWLNVTTIVLTASAFCADPKPGIAVPWQDAVVLAVTAVVIALSWRPARNLFSRRQLMNASFDPLRLVNTYGAFGSISRERNEVVVEGTRDGVEWHEYAFRGKPTDPRERPRQWAPYHLRLDWLMWFAGISPAYAYSWFLPFVRKLMENDPATLRLLRKAPFPDAPPKAIRATLYRYRFTTFKERRETGAFWVRTRLGEYFGMD